LLVEELLNDLEEFIPVLFPDDGVRALAEFNESLVARVSQLGEQLMRLRTWEGGIPFRVNDERRRNNSGWIVHRFADDPVIAGVDDHPIGNAEIRRAVLGALGIQGEICVLDDVQPTLGNQVRTFGFWDAYVPRRLEIVRCIE